MMILLCCLVDNNLHYPDIRTAEFAFCKMHADSNYQEIPAGAIQDRDVGFASVKLLLRNNYLPSYG